MVEQQGVGDGMGYTNEGGVKCQDAGMGKGNMCGWIAEPRQRGKVITKDCNTASGQYAPFGIHFECPIRVNEYSNIGFVCMKAFCVVHIR